MTKILIRCRNIHIGDTLFASSVAKKFKEQNPESIIHYDVAFLQPIELLMNNPYIDKVYYRESCETDYDVVYPANGRRCICVEVRMNPQFLSSNECVI